MATVRSFVRVHPVLSYYVLTFAISWSGALLVIGGPGSIPAPSAQAAALLPLAVSALLIGPPLAGILMTGLEDGRAGYRELLACLARWRVGLRWYLAALLTAPAAAAATLAVLRFASPEYVPNIVATHDRLALLMTGVVVGLMAGIFEELGWTGFAISRLRRRFGVWTTGLIAGLLWGAWHYIAAFWSSGDAAGAWVPALLAAQMLFYAAVLPPFRMLMVWVYSHTESLPLAMLMHATLTGGVLFVFMPPVIAPVPLLIWYLAMAVVFWIMAAVIAVVSARQAARPSLRHRTVQG